MTWLESKETKSQGLQNGVCHIAVISRQNLDMSQDVDAEHLITEIGNTVHIVAGA